MQIIPICFEIYCRARIFVYKKYSATPPAIENSKRKRGTKLPDAQLRQQMAQWKADHPEEWAAIRQRVKLEIIKERVARETEEAIAEKRRSEQLLRQGENSNKVWLCLVLLQKLK